MNYDTFRDWQQSQKKLRRENLLILGCVAALMALLWFIGSEGATPREQALMEKVRASQSLLWQYRKEMGHADETADPNHTGLIGEEWTMLSTTLGSLPAKRTVCDPRWAVAATRWFDSLGLKRGDRVLVLSSSSFPGMILNILTAAEDRGLKVTFVLSLGSSTWGGNVPGAMWPQYMTLLRSRGQLRTVLHACTPGGEDETGGGLSEEALSEMRRVCAKEGAPLVMPESLQAAISYKMGLIERYKPKLVVSIGGSEANMGDDEAILELSPGLHRDKNAKGGDGVIGRTLAMGIPVLHILNIKELALKEGIPFDEQRTGSLIRGRRGLICSVLSLLVFAALLCGFKGRRFRRLS